MRLLIKHSDDALRTFLSLLVTLLCFTVSRGFTYTRTISYGPGQVTTSESSQILSSGRGTSGSIQIGGGGGGTARVITSGVLPVISTGTVSRVGTAQPQYVAISLGLLNFISAVRGQSGVVLQIQANSEATFDITAQTSQGIRTIKGINKNVLSIFIFLFTKPSLKITTLSKTGHNVNVEVEQSVSGVTSTILLDPHTLSVIKEIKSSPNFKVTKITLTGNHSTIVLSGGTKTETLILPVQMGLSILNKLLNPGTDLNIVSTSSRGATIQLPQFPKDQTKFTVGKLFFTVLSLVRQNPSAKIKVTPQGPTFMLEIRIDGLKKIYPDLSPSLVQVFTILTENPTLSFKVIPSVGGKSTIVLPSNVVTTTATIPSNFTAILQKILSNPHIKVEVKEPTEGNHELLIIDGTQKKVVKLPTSAIQMVISLLKQAIPNFTIIKGSTGNDVVTVHHQTPQTHSVQLDLIKLLESIQHNPTIKILYNINQTSDENYDLTINVGGQKHTFHNLNLNVVNIIIKQIHNPQIPLSITMDGLSPVIVTYPETQAGQVIIPSTSGPSRLPTGPARVPTGPSTVPTGPSTVPTGPSTVPTGPSKTPTQPSGLPTRPSGVPTAPSGAATGPSVMPTGPLGVPTKPSGVPIRPPGVPIAPSGVPMGPSGMPTKPSGVPITPAGVPTAPSGMPTKPSGVPITPAGVPTAPSGMPTKPSGVPITPAGVPTAPSDVPTGQSGMLTKPSGVPTAPSGVPTGPLGMPTKPSGVPITPAGVPTAPSGVPTGPSEMPTKPSGVPITPSGVPTGPSGMPTKPSGVPTAPSGVPTGPLGMPTKPSGVPITPSDVPTGQSGMLTKPSGVPTAPSGVPTGPSGMPTKPSGVPTAPSGVPTGPSEMPTKPSGVPITPSDVPTGQSGMLTKPSGVPTAPSGVPTRPSGIPVGPSEMPTKPSEMPTKPSGVPTGPSEMPTKPSEVPTRPSGIPVGPSEMPTKPSEMPTKPSGVPTGPSEMPTGPSGLPTRPAGIPMGTPGMPTGPARVPTGQSEFPIGPTRFPAGPSGPLTSPTKPALNAKLDLLNLVKNSPQLKLTVEPTGDNYYDITVDDGTHKIHYSRLTIDELTSLINIRKNKDLPFEILPSRQPGQVNVFVPDINSPDTIHMEVYPDIIEAIDQLKNEPTTQITLQPDGRNQFIVTIQNDKKTKTYRNVSPETVQAIIRLRTDDTINITIKPGQDGRLTLLLPKHHQTTVHTKLTPEITSVVQNLAQNPYQTIEIKPSSKPNTFTLTLVNGPNKRSYPDLPADLISIITHTYTNPGVDIEVKPGPDNTIQFVPASPSADTQSFTVSPSVIDIISTLKNNPATKIQVKPGTDRDFTVIVTIDGQAKKYPHLSPDSLRIIFDLQTNPQIPYTVTPTKDGNIVINIPKTSQHQNTVPLQPESKNVIDIIRNNPTINLDIKPDTRGTYTITLDGKTYNNISPSFLLLIITLVSKPTLKFEIVPGYNGQLSLLVPKQIPQMLQVTIPSTVVELIHAIRESANPSGSVQRNVQGGGLDVTVTNLGHTVKYINLSPKLANVLTSLGTNPRLSYKIYQEGGNYVLVLPQRPKDLVVTNVPRDIIKYISDERTKPNLIVKIDSENIKFYEDNKLVKSFPNSNPDTVQLVVLLIGNPDIEVVDEPNVDGQLTVPTLDIPTTDVTIEPTLVSLIHDVQSPNVSSLDIKPSNGKYDVTVTINGRPKTFYGVEGKIVYVLILLRTERNIDINIYISRNGQLSVAVPKGSLKTCFDGISRHFYDYLVKIQPGIKSVSFTLSINGPSLTLNIVSRLGSAVFTGLSGNAVELFTKLLVNPDLTLQSNTGTAGTLAVTLVRQITTLVFKNVKSKFLSLAKSIREDHSTSVALKRTTSILLLLAQGNKGILFDNLDPIIIELFVSLISNPNFHYAAHLESDGSYTLTTQKFNRHPIFNNIDSKLAVILKQLNTAEDAVVFVTRGKNGCGFDVAISVNGGSASKFDNIDPDSLRLVVIFTVNKGVKFVERRTASGLVFDVTLERVENPVFNFNLITAIGKAIDDVAEFMGSVFGNIVRGLTGLVSGVVAGIGGLFGLGTRTTTTTTTTTTTASCSVVRNGQAVGVTTTTTGGTFTGGFSIGSTSGGLIGCVIKAGKDRVGGVAQAGTQAAGTNILGGVASAAGHIFGK